jgi:hypothetical protein
VLFFSSGAIWDYDGVPYEEFERLTEDFSVGRYYHEFIKGQYPSTQRTEDDNFPFGEPKEEQKELDYETIYEVYEPADKTEGRGGCISLGFFKNENVANWVLKNEATGVMGTRSGVGIKEIKVYTGDTVNYENYCKEKIRKQALSKLTSEEKEVLGL